MNKLLTILVLVFGVQAKAGFLAEPFIGYDQSTVKYTDIGGTSSGSTNSGMDYGARLGYRFNQGLLLAVEYAGGSGTNKSDTVGTADSDYTKAAMGAIIGYDFGRFSIWAGYGFSDKVTSKTTGQADSDMTGTNMKVGFGYKVVNHVSVNLDYIIPKYTKSISGGTETDLSTVFTKFDTSGAMLSVSFPFGSGK